jgi:hypothetical protein
MPFTKTIPILRILDEARAKEFYVFGYGACRSVRQSAHFYERKWPRPPRLFQLLAMTATPNHVLQRTRRELAVAIGASRGPGR